MQIDHMIPHWRSLLKSIPIFIMTLVIFIVTFVYALLQDQMEPGIIAVFIAFPTLVYIIFKMLTPKPHLFPAIALFGLSAGFLMAYAIILNY
jgi:hypothetical protein